MGRPMQIQLKRGDSVWVSQYVGVSGEIIVNTDTQQARVMDGVTPGGHPLSGLIYTIPTPSITSPPPQSSVSDTTPVFTSSIYDGIGTHVASYWEIYQTPTNALMYRSGRSTTDLVVLDLGITPTVLVVGSSYYVRVRHENSTGYLSDWSAPVVFTITT